MKARLWRCVAVGRLYRRTGERLNSSDVATEPCTLLGAANRSREGPQEHAVVSADTRDKFRADFAASADICREREAFSRIRASVARTGDLTRDPPIPGARVKPLSSHEIKPTAASHGCFALRRSRRRPSG